MSFELAAEKGMVAETTWDAGDRIQNIKLPLVSSEYAVACVVNNFAICLR
jgi:hypothetical protein